MRLGFLGPEGTFTEQALRTLPEAAGARCTPYPSVPAALDAVRSGTEAAAVVAIENSVEGAVTVTLDELATGDPLVITAEILVPVSFALLARPGTTLGDIRRVATHPHAAAQCRGYLDRELPGVPVVSAGSTAAACEAVAAGADRLDAAVAAPPAAERYGLAVLARGIEDTPGAVTRFVRVARPLAPPAPTGADKTSLVAFIRADHPGALLEILDQFAVRGVNLCRIESRPTGLGLGRYCFSIDCEGHLADARVGEALMGLHRVCADVRFLGSYPRADGVPPKLQHGTAEPDFQDAAGWLAGLRAGPA